MKKYLSAILACCLILSLCGNLYLYSQQPQVAARITGLQTELQTITDSNTNIEDEITKSIADLEAEVAKMKTMHKELAELRQEAEEQKKAAGASE